MTKALVNILKMFVIIGVLVVAVLYIFLVSGIISGQEFQNTAWKAIEIIGTISIASIIIIFVTSLGTKNN
jgi:hypothetical protein